MLCRETEKSHGIEDAGVIAIIALRQGWLQSGPAHQLIPSHIAAIDELPSLQLGCLSNGVPDSVFLRWS